MKKFSVSFLTGVATFMALTLVAFAGGGGMGVQQAYAATVPTTEAVTVYGQGHVSVQADKAMISVNLSAHAKTSKEINKKMRDAQRMMVASLKDYGVQAKDVVVNWYSVYPYMEYNELDGGNKVTAYDGNRTLTVTVRDLSVVEDVQDVLLEMESPVNLNVNNISYVLENTEAAMDQAREMAAMDAVKRSAKMAKVLGVKLGRIVNSVEVNNYMYYPASSSDGSQMVDIYMQVEVSYEIKS